MSDRRVFLVSNDIVPGMGLPVAAPGLRVYGLAAGLAAHGPTPEILVVSHIVDKRWRAEVPAPTPRGVTVVPTQELGSYLCQRQPCVAVLTNSNQIETIEDSDDLRVVIDLFAPKMLELAYQHGPAHPREELRELRERKLKAFRRADAFVVNGAKKVGYFLAWLLQTDRDIRTIPLEVVTMCAPLRFQDDEPSGPVRLAMAGYLQGWSRPGAWVSILQRLLAPDTATLDVLLPDHWGGNHGPVDRPAEFLALLEDPAVTRHDQMPFSEFQGFLSAMDVSIDVFDHTLEREYAMVTRSVVSLTCGVPVVHPPFTEVSPWIDAYDAGWLVDPADLDQLAAVFEEIVSAPAATRNKRDNARRLAREQLDPATATEPLVRLIDSLP